MRDKGQGGPGNGRIPCVKWLSRATRRWYLGLAVIGPCLAVAEDLPPPPSEAAAVADATLYLDLLVNQVPRAELVPVQQRAGRLFLDSEVLRAAGIALPGAPEGELALDGVAGLHSDYDAQNQRLLLQVRRPGCQTSKWVTATCTRPAMRAAVSAPCSTTTCI